MADLSNKPSSPEPKLASDAEPAALPYESPAIKSWREHFASERRWFSDTFSGDKVVDTLKQLAWVVPLTLLIWVYAEREQITKLPNETIPFELISLDPNKSVRLRSQQDRNVVVDLEGPRARLQDVLRQLRGGTSPQGLPINVDPKLSANREHELRTSTLLANHSIFRDNGITVTRSQPDRLIVTVDQLVEEEARVVPQTGIANLEAGSTFEPPTVRVRGPLALIEQAKKDANGQLLVYARVPDNLLRTPGQVDATDLSLDPPPALRDDDRVTLSRSNVDGKLRVRDADVKWTMQSMSISLDQPKSAAEKYQVEYSPSLSNVTLIGPKDVIDLISKPDYEPKPYAQLRVTSSDVGGERRRKLRFVELPQGVRVSDEDLNREVAFKLVAKSGVE